MRFSSTSSPLALFSTALLTLPSIASAERMLYSNSLNPCSANPGFTATLFDVMFTPDNRTITYNINGISSISGKVTAELNIIAYGYVLYNKTLNPCDDPSLVSLCPMNPGTIPIKSNFPIDASVISQVPGIAYAVPDLDGKVRVRIRNKDTGDELACLEAELSNGKTVNLQGVQWAVAAVAGLGLLCSALASGFGHSNTAAHIAANALSLFGFFQAQAMIGMTAVAMPPVVESWTQNFQWSMGIVSVGFMQNISTWYQRSTGGTPSTILSTLATTSVQVQKRSLEMVDRLVARGLNPLSIRANTNAADTSSANPMVIVKGIERVGFIANIEPTNIFLTGLGFFVAFIIVVTIGVALFKGFVEIAARNGWIKSDKFQEFRNGWRIVLKGILFRLILIGYPQMCILCLWELTKRDSVAEVIVALFYFVAMSIALVWAGLKVIRIAKRSVNMHKNPAYILYSDPACLNKWGFLYVQFRATAYYFIFAILAHTVLKALFIAFAQSNGVVQTIGLLIIEAFYLIGVCILRPWMDKKTNTLNISVAVINFINVVFLLVFTNIFNEPGLVGGVMGVIFFIYNAAFALILLLLVFITSIIAIFSKNPDTRYQPMRDDRGSFIKSQNNLNTELDALGATARGDMRMKRDLDEDSDSFSSSSLKRQQHDAAGVPLPASQNASSRRVDEYGLGQAEPFMSARVGSPMGYQEKGGFGARSNNNSPAPAPRYDAYQRSGSLQSNTSYRPQNGGAWQRGAGYEH